MKRFAILLTIIVPLTAVILLFKTFIPPVHADFEVSGPISTDTTWTLANSPYIVTDTLTIEAGVTLTVEAGVEVRVEDDTFIDVDGRLLAIGTSTQPITFTSITNSGPGDWIGVHVYSSGSITMNHAIIEKSEIGIEIEGNSYAPINLTNGIIRNNALAISISPEAAHRLNMNDMSFENNSANRVLIAGGLGNYSFVDDVVLSSQDNLSGYEIPYPLLIPNGITVTIEPGTFILGTETGYVLFDVRGHLEAVGSPSNPITFTSVLDSGPGQWTSIGVNIGSAHFAYTVFRNGMFNLDFLGSSGGPITMENVLISNSSHFGALISTDALHRLEMNNVTFSNNALNAIKIDTSFGNDALIDNVTLKSMPGLDSYIITPDSPHLIIPSGMTLTLEAGTTLTSENNIFINDGGLLKVNGTVTNPATVGSQGMGICGTIQINHAIINRGGSTPGTDWGLGIRCPNQNPVIIENSTLEDIHYPVLVATDALHRLEMDNVTFNNNVVNRVIIDSWGNNEDLIDNVTLTPQPGLEGYEFYPHNIFQVPTGITLTVEPGVKVMMPDAGQLTVQGNLQAQGTPEQPITFTTAISNDMWYGLFIGSWEDGVGDTGSAHLAHAVLSNADIAIAATKIGNDEHITITNSILTDNNHGLIMDVTSLHQISLDNVNFVDNEENTALIGIYWPEDHLEGDTVLSAQPGLEGYELDGDQDLRIPSVISLTLEPGVTLMSSAYAQTSINVSGTLKAEGLPANPVTFTSATDSGPGEWEGIIIDGGEVNLEHSTVRYATNNLSLLSPTSTVNISRSHIISASLNGITMQAGSLQIDCSTVNSNGGYGLWVDNIGTPTAVINQSEIVGNGIAGISNTHSLPIIATYNWWGSANGPAGDGSGSGDAVFGNVNFTPWLNTEPDCSSISESSMIFLPLILKP